MLVSQTSPVYTYWQPLIQPWVHYVPYMRWFEDLPAVLRRLQADDELAERIKEGGKQFAENFISLDAAKDYTAVLFNKYSQLLAEPVTDADIAVVSCSHVKDGPMGCDKGWREWDGVYIKYPPEFKKKVLEGKAGW